MLDIIVEIVVWTLLVGPLVAIVIIAILRYKDEQGSPQSHKWISISRELVDLTDKQDKLKTQLDEFWKEPGTFEKTGKQKSSGGPGQ